MAEHIFKATLMSTLQELQKPIDIEIVNAMIFSTPEEWLVIELTISRKTKKENTGEFSHQLSSSEGHSPISPDMSLFEATYNLDELMQSHNAFIKEAIYRAKYIDDGWSYEAEFEYYD